MKLIGKRKTKKNWLCEMTGSGTLKKMEKVVKKLGLQKILLKSHGKTNIQNFTKLLFIINC